MVNLFTFRNESILKNSNCKLVKNQINLIRRHLADIQIPVLCCYCSIWNKKNRDASDLLNRFMMRCRF